jgi:hypothetical protein
VREETEAGVSITEATLSCGGQARHNGFPWLVPCYNRACAALLSAAVVRPFVTFAAVYFLHEGGYTLQRPFLKDEVIRFCVGLAGEGQSLAEGKPVAVQTITQIATWLKGPVVMPASEET